ncbi:hypothetical protein C0583_01940 [Candidatus Parcubacteria bacterium]|nr:MAG: hypothetical protein C0583_01940 [Candidatus Parcubacteria bacterium]
MILSFARVIKFSFQDIFRNIWLSLVTIIILILALFTVNMILVVKVVGDAAVGAIKDKIDINLFIKPDTSEKDIEILESRIRQISNVKETRYISKEEALILFKDKHQDNPEILQSLTELGQNPLTPTIIITPANLNEFDNLINQLNALDSNIIESKNFTNYESMLEKINSITERVSEAGIFLSTIFVFITLLVVYNSVRVAIYTHRREITIMRLVGASNWFIQMPYLFSSLIYSSIGVIVIMFLYYPFLALLQPYLKAFFVGYNVDLVNYFYSNIFTIFGTQFLVSAIIIMLASLLAVRKYSKS